MPFTPNQNHLGTMYAGALFTLAKLPGEVICISSFDNTTIFPVIVDLEINFIKPVTTKVTTSVSLTEE